jgi:hypothetical protein
MTSKEDMTSKEKQKSSGQQERQLSEGLEMTFPASDPPASTQLGGGIAGPAPGPPKPERGKGIK